MSRAASSAGSRGTKGSRMSRSSYRRVAPTSQVDEALFGNTNTPSAAKRAGVAAPGGRAPAAADVVSMESIEKLLGNRPQINAPDSAVISGGDLERMRNAATIVSAQDLAATRQQMQQTKAEQQAKAKARKERMMAAEAARKANAPKSDSENRTVAKNNATLSVAKQKLDEELDDVKAMNQMMAYAKCVTIRDAQISEKVEMQQEMEEEERRLDTIMEIERVKAIQRASEVESAKAKERRSGALVIVDQIKVREAQRELEMEQKDIEQQMMLKHIQKMEEEDRKALEEKKVAGQKLLEQVLSANEGQIEKKHEYKLLEEAEEQRRLGYLIDKEERENSLRAEADRIKAEKEEETLRLRAQQEKAADTKAEEDALRAKRAQEAAEREWREKELSAAMGAQEKQEAMKIARNVQMREKERKLAEQAQLEKLEFERILMVQAEADARDREEMEKRIYQNVHHSDELRETIARNEVERKEQRQKFLSEGGKLEARMQVEAAKIEAIKQKKLQEMEMIGVPDKYRTELMRHKVAVG
jgi:hypothetical protein